MPAPSQSPSRGRRRGSAVGWWAALLLVLTVALSHGLGAEGPSGHHLAGAVAQAHETTPVHEAGEPRAAGEPHGHGDDHDHGHGRGHDGGGDSSEDGHGMHACLSGQPAQGVDLPVPGAAVVLALPEPYGLRCAAGAAGRAEARPPPADGPSPGRLRI
ncbi:hypothetical protein ACIA8O_13315 [Kitasatospora sp. NPDC051853]|uniref:hypothetical protein n=1 Tax=Kitasatospora sp. NPDC051853 TaxID=3364058 RepID=UPI00379E7650